LIRGGREVSVLIPGVVVFELDVHDSGSIAAIGVLHDVPFTADFAKEAFRQWDFTSAVKDGKPTPSRTIVAISFVVRHR
jgi:hypothetical protein